MDQREIDRPANLGARPPHARDRIVERPIGRPDLGRVKRVRRQRGRHRRLVVVKSCAVEMSVAGANCCRDACLRLVLCDEVQAVRDGRHRRAVVQGDGQRGHAKSQRSTSVARLSKPLEAEPLLCAACTRLLVPREAFEALHFERPPKGAASSLQRGAQPHGERQTQVRRRRRLESRQEEEPREEPEARAAVRDVRRQEAHRLGDRGRHTRGRRGGDRADAEEVRAARDRGDRAPRRSRARRGPRRDAAAGGGGRG
mmetsp:Transcript_29600/g.91535  ORF Transcript_29600/g.91535 Transcript_29600/m.91535 type:complete len:256 (-) Transcript_29600:19-786(-)